MKVKKRPCLKKKIRKIKYFCSKCSAGYSTKGGLIVHEKRHYGGGK